MPSELTSQLVDLVYSFYRPLRNRKAKNDLKPLEQLALYRLYPGKVMCVGKLQECLNCLPAQMTRIINAITPLINYEIDPDDKRRVRISLNEAGKRACEQYFEDMVKRVDELITPLSVVDRSDLLRILSRLHADKNAAVS